MTYIAKGSIDENRWEPFEQIRSTFGFLPNFFRAQTLRPDLIEAELALIGGTMVKDGALSRRHKEYVFLVCSAANLSTYCVTAHCEIVRMLGIHGPEPEQVALDYNRTNLPPEDKALLSFALKLNKSARTVDAEDVDGLRTYGYSDAQILETILMVGIAQFANTVSFGLGTVPDFEPTQILGEIGSRG
jgi:uncharacterized peroxidase-related enzyme